MRTPYKNKRKIKIEGRNKRIKGRKSSKDPGTHDERSP
jgi:hypothetical protein